MVCCASHLLRDVATHMLPTTNCFPELHPSALLLHLSGVPPPPGCQNIYLHPASAASHRCQGWPRTCFSAKHNKFFEKFKNGRFWEGEFTSKFWFENPLHFALPRSAVHFQARLPPQLSAVYAYGWIVPALMTFNSAEQQDGTHQYLVPWAAYHLAGVQVCWPPEAGSQGEFFFGLEVADAPFSLHWCAGDFNRGVSSRTLLPRGSSRQNLFSIQWHQPGCAEPCLYWGVHQVGSWYTRNTQTVQWAGIFEPK